MDKNVDFRTFRECLEPYKLVIGQILLLLPNVKTVVNKINSIDNTYRNFAMETLAGMLKATSAFIIHRISWKYVFNWQKMLETTRYSYDCLSNQ